MDLGLNGKKALVAASSLGLGRETARSLLQAGCEVVVSGRDQGRLDEAVADIGGGTAIVADLSSIEGATALVGDAIDALDQVDILVTNNGGPPPGDFASTDVDAYQSALNLNLLAMIGLCKAAVPPMQERGWGRVVAITSISVRQPIGMLILSNTARAGFTGFLKTMALEVAPDGVTVNSIQPGLHTTARLTGLRGGDIEAMGQSLPVGVLGDPADFGQVAAFLCSDQAKFITGAALPVDGGQNSALL